MQKLAKPKKKKKLHVIRQNKKKIRQIFAEDRGGGAEVDNPPLVFIVVATTRIDNNKAKAKSQNPKALMHKTGNVRIVQLALCQLAALAYEQDGQPA